MALADLISILAKHEVEFIIVGGMAAVLRGTPVNTFDLNVVYERSTSNIERLLHALDEFQAIMRAPLSRFHPKAKSPLAHPGREFRTAVAGAT